MISKLLNTLERGFRVMKSNNRLIFVAFLIFFFPILFIYITQGFFDTAYSNIETVEKKTVDILHTSLVALVSDANVDTNAATKAIETQLAHYTDITEIRLVKETPEGLVIVYSANPDLIGVVESNEVFYRTSLMDINRSHIFPGVTENARVWRAVRAIKKANGEQFFISSEHSFKMIDEVMAKRRQQSFYGLTVIFLFLMGLAYWIARQTDWQKRHKSLEEKMVERDLFTNMIAHEFRTPLTAINGYSSFLAESKNTSPDEKRYVATIQVSTGRLLALVNDFLEVARIQSGKMQVEKVPTDIQTIITGVIDVLKETATKKGLELTYKPFAVPIIHPTDAKRLHQVLQNIISNSVKYTEKGSVEVVTEVTPLSVTIRVKDTGMGISAEDQQKLFTPFSRVGGVEKTNIAGTGLGMWITKQIIEILGGTVSIESIRNVGTHVVITLKR